MTVCPGRRDDDAAGPNDTARLQELAAGPGQTVVARPAELRSQAI